MKKHYRITALVIAMAIVLLCGIRFYMHSASSIIYRENAAHLQESYVQVSKALTLFTQRNWNVLSDWSRELGRLETEQEMKEMWENLKDGKSDWQYSDFFMFNEENQFITAAGKKGTADSITGAFDEMFQKNRRVISSYTASSGIKKIVLAAPLPKVFISDDVSYTGLAISYDASVVENLMASNLYEGQSDCYVVRPDGKILLSLTSKTEIPQDVNNLISFYTDADIVWKDRNPVYVQECIEQQREGNTQYTYRGRTYYMVSEPVGIEDWTLLGIVRSDAVDYGDRNLQKVTLGILGVSAALIMLLVVLALVSENRAKLLNEEKERLLLEKEKERATQFLEGISRIVDRYAVADLENDRYEYHELILDEPLYPETGAYWSLVDYISRRYIVLTNTENAKVCRMIAPDYLRKVLRKESDILKFEYCIRNENIYKVMHVIPIEWAKDNRLTKVMLVSMDIGQKIELENMANTDGLTGLFNERYFTNILQNKEKKKLPFVLFYIDLDRFKPINDTYGHSTGDQVLQEIARRLQECIRSNDYAFRIGGDEFALIICSAYDKAFCCHMAERIQIALTEPIKLAGKTLQVGVSCGCAAFPEDSSEAEEVRAIADQRMYEEKEKHHREDPMHSGR